MHIIRLFGYGDVPKCHVVCTPGSCSFEVLLEQCINGYQREYFIYAMGYILEKLRSGDDFRFRRLLPNIQKDFSAHFPLTVIARNFELFAAPRLRILETSKTIVQTACLARVIAPIARPDMTRTRMTLQGGTQARNMGGTAWNKSAGGASFLARSFAHRSYFGMTYGTGLPRVFKVCRGNSGLSRHSSSHLVDSAFLQAPTTP